MKTMKLIVMTILMAFAFTACKKDKDPTPVAPVTTNAALEGTWSGTYAPEGGTATDFDFIILKDNVFQLVGDNASTGTWKLTGGTKFEATVVAFNKTFTYTATFNKTGGAGGTASLTEGTAKSSDNPSVIIAKWSSLKPSAG